MGVHVSIPIDTAASHTSVLGDCKRIAERLAAAVASSRLGHPDRCGSVLAGASPRISDAGCYRAAGFSISVGAVP